MEPNTPPGAGPLDWDAEHEVGPQVEVQLRNGKLADLQMAMAVWTIVSDVHRRSPELFDELVQLSNGTVPSSHATEAIRQFGLLVSKSGEIRPLARDVIESSWGPAGNGEGGVLVSPLAPSVHAQAALADAEARAERNLTRFVQELRREGRGGRSER